MQVFGIVGWKNNGKTTLVERLIAKLCERGYVVSSVKHAHHNVDVDEPGRDSYRHRAAGAKETMLATGNRWALMHENRGEETPPLEELLLRFEPCDLVIIEGYKGEQHAKLEVVRELNHRGLLQQQVPNVVAIATDRQDVDSNAPLLDLNDIDAIADFVIEYTGITKQSSAAQVTNDCYQVSQGLLPAQHVWDSMRKLAQTKVTIAERPLGECHGLRLAKAVTSPHDSPRFNNVAVDGWAVKYADLVANNFQLVAMAGEANAGGNNLTSLEAGKCLRVFTGARLPAGADTIVMQEDVQTDAGIVTFPNDCKANSNWRSQGEDVAQGDIIIQQGQRLRPQDIGIAAAAGIASLEVYCPVKVALFSTGDEVHELGRELPADGIYDVNRYMLKALYESMHCQVTDLGILEDDYDTIKQALQNASTDHQLIVTSGGASTGNHDHIAQILKELGQVHAWRVAIKPGRPLAFGQLGQALFLGLPGNPVAANVCSSMFGQPLINAIGGGKWQHPQSYPQILGFEVNKKAGRREWLRVYREQQLDGSYLLKRSASHGSGILTSLTKADGLVEVDEATSYLPNGAQVNFLPFSSFTD